jgi:hypothetical protein
MGLTPAESFADITSDEETQARLEEAYEDVNDIDVWGGALAEDHVPGAIVGELLLVVLKEQFERLRDGDRFWYQNVMSKKEARKLEKTRLSDVIRHNTSIRGEVPKNVFLVKKNHNKN